MEDTNSRKRVEKLQQQVEKLCSATVRASCAHHSFRFSGQRPEINGQSAQIRAPHLRPDYSADDFRSFRGAADAIALRLKHSDSELHRQLMPQSNIGQLVFEIFEQLRCESLVNELMSGTKRNLEHRFRQWCKQFFASDAVDNQLGVMIFMLVQVVWCRLTRLPMNEESEDLIEPSRMMMAPHIGGALLGMRKNTDNQRIFATHSQTIADVLDSLQKSESDDEADPDSKSNVDASHFSLFLEESSALGDDLSVPTQSLRNLNARQLDSLLKQYKIYTDKNDQIIHAHKLVPSSILDDYCDTQDKRFKKQVINIPRLARDLAKIVPGKQLRGWDFSKDEGYIDASKLTRLITSPQDHRIFRSQQQLPMANCLVTLLLDNSGSMKEHIEPVSMLINILCKALEMIGASSEVLGFTTKSWQGGQSYRQWQRNLRPQNPGRLCDTRHIIYKDADSKLQSAKRSLAAMIKLDLFREGIDGEALLWAANRQQQRTEQRKILIVLSDGCPMESMTNNQNSKHYLDTHLRQVASAIENSGNIELYALGFGLDLSPYYRNSLALENIESVDQALLGQILQMLKNRKS